MSQVHRQSRSTHVAHGEEQMMSDCVPCTGDVARLSLPMCSRIIHIDGGQESN